MKIFFKSLLTLLIAGLLNGCLATGVTPIGTRCDSQTEQGPVWTWPLACQPNG